MQACPAQRSVTRVTREEHNRRKNVINIGLWMHQARFNASICKMKHKYLRTRYNSKEIEVLILLVNMKHGLILPSSAFGKSD